MSTASTIGSIAAFVSVGNRQVRIRLPVMIRAAWFGRIKVTVPKVLTRRVRDRIAAVWLLRNRTTSFFEYQDPRPPIEELDCVDAWLSAYRFNYVARNEIHIKTLQREREDLLVLLRVAP